MSFFSERWGSMKAYAALHKWTSIVIALVIVGAAYGSYTTWFRTSPPTSYVLATVQKGTIVVSVTGSGQVSTSNEIDIKPKVSGQVIWVAVKPGDTVRAGQALVGLDRTDAERAVVNAEQSLATAKLQYQKDEAQAPIDYQKTVDALAVAQEDLATTFNDTFNTVSNTYLDLPTVITGAQNMLYGYDLSSNATQWNVDVISNMFNNDEVSKAKLTDFAERARDDYAIARAKYDVSFAQSKTITRTTSTQDLERFLDASIDTTTALAQALQSELNLLGSVVDIAQTYNRKLPTAVTTLQTSTRTYLSTVNTDLGNLLAQKKAITTGKQAVTTYQNDITLLNVGNTNGSNPISLQISKNNLASQETSLTQLKEDLQNYTIVAPFDGMISVVNAKKGDTVPSVAASIITTQKIAIVSLNEVDVAKIAVGQKATLTFDAVDGLSIVGRVAEIDTVGTVSQGVVTYNVKINFETQDERIKSGMSTSAAIIIDVKQDVLSVPNSAIKTINGGSVVEVLDGPGVPVVGGQGVTSASASRQIPIETGISNDTMTEVVSGLKEGEQVVSRTVAAAASTASTAPSLFSTGGRNTGGIHLPTGR